MTAAEILERASTLENKFSPWAQMGQEIAQYVMPRKDQILHFDDSPTFKVDLFDNTAIQANRILANGCLAWMTPHESRWFAYDPPEYLMMDDEAKQWYRYCSEITAENLARSNFYSLIHELYLDRGAFGTSVIFCDEGKQTALNFRVYDFGEYFIDEDDQQLVDTIYRKFDLTARQLVLMFGIDKVGKEVREAFEDPKRMGDKFCVVHAMYPREYGDIDPRMAKLPKNFPIASCYVLQKEERKLSEGGYKENPFACTRFLRWGKSPYGWSPAWMALPEARQLNFLEKQLDALAEVTTFPRLLMPSEFEGTVDLSAGGITYFNPANPAARPQEWATAGRYDVGFERSERKRKAINEAYHVDLFQMFAQMEGQQPRTALEIQYRHNEKLIQFSPTFARMTTELFQPMLRRAWAVQIRRGEFPPPPFSVIQGGFLPEPKVAFSSRIALAIQGLENTSLYEWLDSFAPMFQFKPEIMDNINWDVAARDVARNKGLPHRFLMPEKQMMAIREQRAKQEEQMRQIAMAGEMAKAAKNLGGVPPNSPVSSLMAPAIAA